MIKSEIQGLLEALTEDMITVSKGLTKAKYINKKIGNAELEKLITGEVEGKYGDETLPEYRLIFGESTFEFVNRLTGITDVQKIPMPEGKHFNGKSTNFRPIMFTISEIEQLVQESTGKSYRLLFTTGQLEVAKKILNPTDGWELNRAWWSHSPTSFPSIIFRAKQSLIDILLEIENTILEQDYHEKIFSSKTQFDASWELTQLIEKSQRKIILIDGYIDGVTLKLLSSKKESVSVQVLTDPRSISEQLEVLVDKFNLQYKNLTVGTSKSFHDRFLIIDDINFYQIGASMKDLGQKTFSFIKLKEASMTNALMEKFQAEWNTKK